LLTGEEIVNQYAILQLEHEDILSLVRIIGYFKHVSPERGWLSELQKLPRNYLVLQDGEWSGHTQLYIDLVVKCDEFEALITE
jgi:hypothetical protein